MTRRVDPFGLVGVRLDGKYDVEAVIAEGGFGVVYRARHRTLHKPVAVKVLKVPETLHGPARREFLDRFALEARTIAALDHPAVVRVLDFGASPMPEGEAAPWMVLEWLTGSTLAGDLDARRGRGGRAPAECLEILRPAFDALAAAHDDGVAHRDVKPENLFLAEGRRGERCLRVLDFGIAKAMEPDEHPSTGETATRTQQRAFSPEYAAPEQLAGTRTGPWTDVYALGLILTELLTDAPPYDGTDLQELFTDAVSSRRPTPAKRGFDVGAWEAVIARAVALKTTERFANAREFLAALEQSIPVRVSGPASARKAYPRPQQPDTLSLANSAHAATPRYVRPSGATWAGFVGLATLALLAGTLSYLTASHPNRAHRTSPLPIAVTPLPEAPPQPGTATSSDTPPRTLSPTVAADGGVTDAAVRQRAAAVSRPQQPRARPARPATPAEEHVPVE